MQPPPPKLFRYEAVWSGKQEGRDIIESVWPAHGEQNNPVGCFKASLERCREKLQRWAKSNARDTKKKLRTNLQKLRSLQESNQGDLNGRITDAQKQVNELLEEEELNCSQLQNQLALKKRYRN
ncbi:unnamed protein product [Fraxinus pennsylvanica]|uniref:Uncharacterized protein n=1 Tax=Fraxinus pennsylvanica TaxID=56036 RepID=A0AAD2A039_9LAMI|nr:unnamed protein product [Fraxinus pennsylvanica]